MTSLPAGGEGVRVTLQVPLPRVARRERKVLLKQEVDRLREDLEAMGVVVDPDSLSVSAQTAEATIPVDDYDGVVETLKKKDVRVDPMVDRKVV